VNRIEVITSVERRHPLGGEGAMVAAMDEPGAVVTEIARSLPKASETSAAIDCQR
jgi:hypothetical protein